MQVVEDVKKDILGLFFSAEKLNVIDDEDVNHLVKVTKVIHGVIPDGINELVCELLGAHVQNGEFWILLLYFKADGVRQVCFA
jgi:hypothetical protein